MCLKVPGTLIDENLDDLGHFPVRADKCSALTGKMFFSLDLHVYSINTNELTIKFDVINIL